MKKIICILITITTLITMSACSGSSANNEFETAKTITTNYANAIIKAWQYGLDEEVIFENESITDFNSQENLDLKTLAEVTGIEQSKIEEALHEEHETFSKATVNKLKSRFFHMNGKNNVEIYHTTALYEGNTPELTPDEYSCICYNLEMVKYLFEKVYGANLNSNYEKLKDLKEYADSVMDTCLDDSMYIYLCPTNLELVTANINQKIGEI